MSSTISMGPEGSEGVESERDASHAGDDSVDAAIGRVGPDSVDGGLIRRRLMAEMFGREVPAPRFGRFELRDRIGHGGMGVVYRAWDPQLERTVAIKVIDTAEVGQVLRERALREARSLAKLAHPNVITVFEAGLADRRVLIAMELVKGTTLQQWLEQTPRPDDVAILRHWIAVGRGLQAAHRRGLVHRDVKPSNVLIGEDGRARLIDFGLVHGGAEESSESDAGGIPTEGDSNAARSSEAERTGKGFVGTYRYAAPEQRRGESVGAAADQYSLCVCIWESLTGVMPPQLPAGSTLPRGCAPCCGVARPRLPPTDSHRFRSCSRPSTRSRRRRAVGCGGWDRRDWSPRWRAWAWRSGSPRRTTGRPSRV